jgi:multidrug efflux pump subunit AcrA (membrane-fusion protein)
MMCLSNAPTRFFLLFGLGLTIGTTNAIAQAQSSPGKPVTVEGCRVELIDTLDLAAPVAGVLEFVTPEVGDDVIADEPVAGLESDVMKAQKAIAVKEAQNDVEIQYARKAAELADAELRKALEANRRLANTVAQVEVERLKLASQRAHLQIQQAQHQLDVASLKADEAEANVQVYQIPSKITGVVTRRYKSAGEAVRQGDIIMKIESTSRLHVEGYIKLQDKFRVKRGDKVKVRLNIPGLDMAKEQQELDGVLKLVNLSAELGQDVRVVAEVQNPDNILIAGVPTTMVIYPGTGKAVQTTQLSR